MMISSSGGDNSPPYGMIADKDTKDRFYPVFT